MFKSQSSCVFLEETDSIACPPKDAIATTTGKSHIFQWEGEHPNVYIYIYMHIDIPEALI